MAKVDGDPNVVPTGLFHVPQDPHIGPGRKLSRVKPAFVGGVDLAMKVRVGEFIAIHEADQGSGKDG